MSGVQQRLDDTRSLLRSEGGFAPGADTASLQAPVPGEGRVDALPFSTLSGVRVALTRLLRQCVESELQFSDLRAEARASGVDGADLDRREREVATTFGDGLSRLRALSPSVDAAVSTPTNAHSRVDGQERCAAVQAQMDAIMSTLDSGPATAHDRAKTEQLRVARRLQQEVAAVSPATWAKLSSPCLAATSESVHIISSDLGESTDEVLHGVATCVAPGFFSRFLFLLATNFVSTRGGTCCARQ